MVFCLDPSRKITQYFLDKWEIKEGLPSLEVYDIKQGKDGYIWIATGGGIVRFDGINFKVFNKSTNMEFETSIMRNILVDKNGDLFFGTVGGGVIILKDGKFTAIKIGKEISQNYVKIFIRIKMGITGFLQEEDFFYLMGKN